MIKKDSYEKPTIKKIGNLSDLANKVCTTTGTEA